MRSPLHLLLFFLPVALFAQSSRPTWTIKRPADTGGQLYFVGHAADVATETEGVKLAAKDAKEQLIRQEFGTEIKLDSTQSETLKDISLDSVMKEVSDEILVKGIKQVETYTEPAEGKVAVWVLYSIPKSDVALEKKRVDSLRAARPDSEPVASSKEFNNGGKPKLRIGMKKSQVLEQFGVPDKVDGDTFTYSDKKFCEKSTWGDYYACWVWFDENKKVRQWNDLKPGYTSDLDDAPEKPLVKKSISSRHEQGQWMIEWKDNKPKKCVFLKGSLDHILDLMTEVNGSCKLSDVQGIHIGGYFFICKKNPLLQVHPRKENCELLISNYKNGANGVDPKAFAPRGIKYPEIYASTFNNCIDSGIKQAMPKFGLQKTNDFCECKANKAGMSRGISEVEVRACKSKVGI